MIIRPAIPSDCPALLNLVSIMVSKNLLCMEKYPDYAKLLQHPNRHIIMVATLADGRIIAAMTAIERVFIFRGNRLPAYQLGELKTDLDFRESLLLFKLMKRMMSKLQKTGKSLLIYENPGICTNFPMINLDDTIPFQEIQSIMNYIILPRQLPFKVTIPLTVTGYDELPLKTFYDRCYTSNGFGPVVDRLQSATHFTCTQNQIIKAALSVAESDELGQQTKVHFPARSSWSLLGKLRGLVKLPSAEQSGNLPRTLIVKYFGCDTGHESTLLSLLEHAMHFAWENKYQYLSLAVNPEDDLLNKLIRPIARWNSRSTLRVSVMKDSILFDEPVSTVQILDPLMKRRT